MKLDLYATPVQRRINALLIILPIVILVLLARTSSRAATFTWDGNGGGGNPKWSNGINWVPDGAPPTSGADLIFAGTFKLAPSMDVSYSILSLTFASGAGAFTLASAGIETLTIGTGGITNSSTNLQTISSPLILGAAQTWDAASGALTINSATVNLAGFVLTINGSFNTIISSAISSSPSGTNGLTKNGTGILTLSGTTANTYTGTTTVNAGELDLNKTASVNAIAGNLTIGDGSGTDTVKLLASNQIANTSDVTISSSGVLNLNNNAETIDALNASFSTASVTLGTGTLTVGGNNEASATFAGVISGTSGSFTKIGTGTQILTGSNSYSGTTTISGGTLQIGNGGTTGTLGTGNVVDNANLSFNRSDTITVGNAISGSGTLTQAGAGTTILTGGNSYAGTTTITSGTLQIGNGGTTGTLGSGNVVDNAALSFNRSDSITVGNAISGSGTLTQAGAGTTTLSGVNTYAGGTTVSAGTLLVNGGAVGVSSGTGSGTVLVNNSGTLGGTGNISGSVMVNDTATINAGPSGADATPASVGTLRVGALTLASTSTFHADASGTALANWDKIVVAGTADLGSAIFDLDIASGLNFTAGTTYTLIDASTLLGTFATYADNTAYNFDGYDFTVLYDTANGDFNLKAVPEPSTWAAGALALAAVAFTQRRRIRTLAQSAA